MQLWKNNKWISKTKESTLQSNQQEYTTEIGRIRTDIGAKGYINKYNIEGGTYNCIYNKHFILDEKISQATTIDLDEKLLIANSFYTIVISIDEWNLINGYLDIYNIAGLNNLNDSQIIQKGDYYYHVIADYNVKDNIESLFSINLTNAEHKNLSFYLLIFQGHINEIILDASQINIGLNYIYPTINDYICYDIQLASIANIKDYITLHNRHLTINKFLQQIEIIDQYDINYLGNQNEYSVFTIDALIDSKKENMNKILSNYPIVDYNYNNYDKEFIKNNSKDNYSILTLCIKSERLMFNNKDGLILYLIDHPIQITYLLDTPIIKDIEITNNDLIPIIKGTNIYLIGTGIGAKASLELSILQIEFTDSNLAIKSLRNNNNLNDYLLVDTFEDRMMEIQQKLDTIGSCGELDILRETSNKTLYMKGLKVTSNNAYSFLFGDKCTTSSAKTFTFGYNNTTIQDYSVVFGYNNYVRGIGSFSAGGYNTIDGYNSKSKYSTAFGYKNTIQSEYGFITGANNSIGLYGQFSAAFGEKNTIVYSHSFVCGKNNDIIKSNGFACGVSNSCSGVTAFACGTNNKAKGYLSFVEGNNNICSGTNNHTAGISNECYGSNNFVINNNNFVNGDNNFIANKNNSIKSNNSVCFGEYNTIDTNQNNTFIAGNHNIATYNTEFIIGKYNSTPQLNLDTINQYAFCIGNGSSNTDRSNAFKVEFNGSVYGMGAYNTTGADYAEYFEWYDGNPNNEDRIGLFVTLIDNKIQIAKTNDYILGVVSATAAIIGNSDNDSWQGKYKRDNFGRLLTQQAINSSLTTTYILNETYDSNKTYISRKNRKEWSTIGMLGQLIVRDDGSCKVNSYCSVNEEGIAINSLSTGYRVLKRIDDNTVLILFR